MNRTGVICGECKENFSIAINSYHFICTRTPCGDETKHYPLFIWCLRIRALHHPFSHHHHLQPASSPASSASSGFILFAQMISLDVITINSNSDITFIDKAYLFVYGIFNINSFADVMHPFCIGKNFTALDVLLMEYTSASYTSSSDDHFLLQCKRIRFLCCCGKKNLSIQSSSS